MALALRLGRRGLGNVWPNPAVGCVLVRDGRVVGRGWTQPGGRPHAETEALARAGGLARGATAYVSLEPCAHHGATPPCTDALIRAGIARVVAAATDPDPRVAGAGLRQLSEGGVRVDLGLGRAEAEAANQGFFLRMTEGRPLFTLKAAASLDGRIGTRTGDSRWITGPLSRSLAHRLRASHDGLLIGSATALADDPSLDCRLPGLAERSPVRIVVDGRLRLPDTSALVRTAARIPTWVVTLLAADGDRKDRLTDRGVRLIEVDPDPAGHPDARATAGALAAAGLTRVLIEGGGTVAASFLRAGLVDRVAWFQAPLILGGDGTAAVGEVGVATVVHGLWLAAESGPDRLGEDVFGEFRTKRRQDPCLLASSPTSEP